MKNKTAIVTGASRGIGRAIALKLGEQGVSVVVNYAKNRQAAEEVCTRITDMGAQALSVCADMRNTGEITALFDQTLQRFGGLDILVNNAGMALFKKIEDISEDEFEDIFALNVKGLFFACQQAAKKMADNGKIINISTSVTKMMLPHYGAYAATKGAVEQITKVLAKELGHRQIAVNAVSPGPVDTELFRQGKTEEQIQNLADMAAFGRIGSPGDIAGVVALLISGEAGWISGQNLCVNGGFAA
ncbi:MAG: SDR family oxidoreductase [Desulfobacterales bacterium]|nr:SDR family oxidoreductase [Desulfobacterales bacterium]